MANVEDLTGITDEELILRIREGSYAALDRLIRRHQSFIYNVALRYALNPQEAQDLSQEAMLKIVTDIGSFAGRSTFRTWAYRIVVNTFLNSKRGLMEKQITTFADYGEALDSLPLTDFPAKTAPPDAALLVQEAKLSCMLGMLLCLDREQRLIYILGDIFALPAETASVLFDLQPPAFRKRLQRARADLRNFMDQKCGLVNKTNPCRCRRKTQAFIRAGWVNASNLKFTRPTLKRVGEHAKRATPELDAALETEYSTLYRQHPYYDGPELATKFRALLQDDRLRDMFGLG